MWGVLPLRTAGCTAQQAMHTACAGEKQVMHRGRTGRSSPCAAADVAPACQAMNARKGGWEASVTLTHTSQTRMLCLQPGCPPQAAAAVVPAVCGSTALERNLEHLTTAAAMPPGRLAAMATQQSRTPPRYWLCARMARCVGMLLEPAWVLV